MAGTPAFSVMETGDIILAVEGKLVTRFRVSRVALYVKTIIKIGSIFVVFIISISLSTLKIGNE